MRKLSLYIGSQFKKPRGFVGKCCCIVMNVINNAMYRRVLQYIDADEKTKILDIGYGNGYLINRIYKKYSSIIYGIDISEDMKKEAEKRNEQGVKNGNIKLSVGDCCNCVYSDNFFDIITTVNTVYFWQSSEVGLAEIYRILKPNGVFYNVVYTKEWLQRLSYTKEGFHFFEKQELCTLGKQSGFSNIAVIDISKNKSFMVIYKK